MGSKVVFVVLSLILLLAARLTLAKQVQASPDFARLSVDEREMITSACGLDRHTNDTTQYYYDCIRSQLAALRASSGKPDLSQLTSADREIITSACWLDRQINGPAQYYDCLRNHLVSLQVTSSVAASDAQQQPAGIADPPSDTTAIQRSEKLDPIILLVAASCSTLIIAYSYKRFRRRCSGCDSRTSNSTLICDSCQARFRAAEIRLQEEQMEAESEKQSHQEEAKRQTEHAWRREAETTAEQQRRKGEIWERLRTLRDLQALTRIDFGTLVAWLFSGDGYRVSRCEGSGNEDIDMVLEMEGSKDIVRRQQSKRDIGLPVIREFYGSMKQARARKGFFIATASFTRRAKEFVDGKPITLIDGHYLLAWLSWARTASEDGSATQLIRELDPYDVLGISPGASKDEIRSAYRGLVAKYHPDKLAHLGHEFQGIAREKALAINRAFEILNGS
jgi:DnaJ-domain-containing protein 1